MWHKLEYSSAITRRHEFFVAQQFKKTAEPNTAEHYLSLCAQLKVLCNGAISSY